MPRTLPSAVSTTGKRLASSAPAVIQADAASAPAPTSNPRRPIMFPLPLNAQPCSTAKIVEGKIGEGQPKAIGCFLLVFYGRHNRPMKAPCEQYSGSEAWISQAGGFPGRHGARRLVCWALVLR